MKYSPKPCFPEHSVILPMLQSIKRPLTGLTAIHNRYGEVMLGRFFNKRILFVSHPNYIEQLLSLEGRGLLSRVTKR